MLIAKNGKYLACSKEAGVGHSGPLPFNKSVRTGTREQHREATHCGLLQQQAASVREKEVPMSWAEPLTVVSITSKPGELSL